MSMATDEVVLVATDEVVEVEERAPAGSSAALEDKAAGEKTSRGRRQCANYINYLVKEAHLMALLSVFYLTSVPRA